MANFQIILCSNKKPGSVFLRLAMWSRYSHSAVYDVEANVVYDSTMTNNGVRWHTHESFIKHYSRTDYRPCGVPASLAPEARAWLAAQLGKRYDTGALVGFLFRRDWSKPDKWFCSEMSEAFRTLFSEKKLRSGLWRVTPHHQDILA